MIPQAPADSLEGVSVVHGQFICSYLHDAHSVVKLFTADAETIPAKLIRELPLPGLGSAGGFGGKRTDTETFYSFTSFTVPGTIYRLDLATGESSVFREPHVDFQPDDFETKQVFYTSKDGTRVPMFITHKRGLKLDGTNPDVALRLRRIRHQSHAALSTWPISCGWKRAASMPCPTCAGAASTARSGTRRA